MLYIILLCMSKHENMPVLLKRVSLESGNRTSAVGLFLTLIALDRDVVNVLTQKRIIQIQAV